MVGRPRDLDDYEQLVREHQGIAFRTAYVITGSAADAEEVVQDAFVKAYRALDRFREDAPFRPWLLAIVANEARNKRRSPAGARASSSTWPRSAPPAARPRLRRRRSSPSEQRAQLLGAIDTLREEHRQVVACRYLLGLNEAETAAALGWRAGTVKSRLSRALARLEAELREEVAP